MPAGRPPKHLTDYEKGRVVSIIEAGGDMAAAASTIGISRFSLMRRLEQDKDLAEKVAEAKEKGTDLAEMVLYRLAIGKFQHEGQPLEPNMTALIFFLKNRRPDKWRDRHEIAGWSPPPGGPLTIQMVKAEVVSIGGPQPESPKLLELEAEVESADDES